MKTATAVTLRPIGDARYLIVRRGAETGAWLFGTFWGWDVKPLPTRDDHEPKPVCSFGLVSQAREWLDSDAGQAWLSSLTGEGTP